MTAQAPDQAAVAQTQAQLVRTPLTEVAERNLALETTPGLNASLNDSEANAAIENMQAC